MSQNTTDKSAKRAEWEFDMKRTDAWLAPPEELTIKGDTEDKLYDARSELPACEKLVKNMMAVGATSSSIIIRKEGQKAIVVAGRRRVIACREANRRLVEAGKEPLRVLCIAKRGDAGEMIGLMIAENEIRLDDTPMNRARKLQRYLDAGKTEEEAMVMFGWEVQQTVTNHLALLELSPAVQAEVESQALAMNHAVQLSRLDFKAQDKAIGEMKQSGAVKGTRAKEAVEKAKRGEKAEAEKKTRMLGRAKVERMVRELSASYFGSKLQATAMKETLEFILGMIAAGDCTMSPVKMLIERLEEKEDRSGDDEEDE